MRSAVVALLAAVAVAFAITAARWPVVLIVLAVFAVAAPFSVLSRVLLAALAAAVLVAAALIVWAIPWALALVIAAVVARPAVGVWRFARSSPATRRNYPLTIWASLRWRWLARNTGLAPVDYKVRHAARQEWAPMGPLSRSLLWASGPEGDGQRVLGRMHYPRARFRPDDFGVVAELRTVPGVGRRECEDAAGHLANYWRCARVQVAQPEPGRLLLRGLRRDPLTLPLPMDAAPPGTYAAAAVQPALRAYLGRDEWGAHRWAPLPGLTGITVGGLPGAGKTSLILSLLCQLAALPVIFVFIDGKGGGDYADWADRAWLSTGDDPAAAVAALDDVHALMRHRFTTVQQQTGHRNAWHRGPTGDFPLVVTVIDECHTFFDLDAVKGNREAEAQVRACRALTGELVKKGRSVLMLTLLVTQKQTADAIPTAIRDNCGLGLSFAVKTRDAAVAALGEAIRDYPTSCPTLLQDPAYVGVATVSLRTGQDPFTRIRCPLVTEEAARDRARHAASHRLAPTPAPGGQEAASLRQAIPGPRAELPAVPVARPVPEEAGDSR